MASPAASLTFTVRRKAAELLAPAGTTPRELKRLSDIDDQDALRYHIDIILFYRHDAFMSGRDPATVLRDAVARALVHYYPLAGRLRELEGRKLAVDCTGEGVLFIEADADVGMEHFGEPPLPPFPGIDELIFDVPGSSEVLGTPLLLFQVTRLSCGGFILAVRLLHSMADAQGLVQFLGAVAELARGAAVPCVRPVWRREVLEARNPPRPSFAHREYDKVPGAMGTMAVVPLIDRSFFFGAKEVVSLRSHLEPEPGLRQRATKLEILVGCLWKCRTMALAPDADEEMRLMCLVSARGKGKLRAIPSGYYGNCFAFPVALSAAGDLCSRPLSYAVQLVKEANAEVDMEYLRSVADLMVQRDRQHIAMAGTFIVSDVTKVGFGELDFGWGRPVFSGTGKIDDYTSFLVLSKNAKGEDGILIPLRLPGPAMDKFVQEMGKMLHPAVNVASTAKSAL